MKNMRTHLKHWVIGLSWLAFLVALGPALVSARSFLAPMIACVIVVALCYVTAPAIKPYIQKLTEKNQ